ncbi:acryloyl-CoA reductase [Salinicoccus sp. YB14-2]|uniref:acrylyl-CoA reductase family protein n=1 Tax=Salinicoccus sp. YB14-2 TaxID=1572701 RepID=UPI00068F726D|nr:acryloyl-CoA reductase [Salinicoccus sp. YB14-2]
MSNFDALLVEKVDGNPEMSIKTLSTDQLTAGDVLIKVHYSSVNYKDALIAVNGQFAEKFPMVPGIDLAGEVVESVSEKFKPGDQVLATSYYIGTRNFGGFSEMARIPSKWLVALPKGLSLREAMTLGTAGFTAALSIDKLERNGLKPEDGKVLVAGASGGVGSLSVNMLDDLGYHVEASTGHTEEAQYLKSIGAQRVIHRDEIFDEDQKSIRKRQWIAAIDPIGGKTTQYILSSLDYGGYVATCGLVGGIDVQTTVIPFISRSIQWIGVDSVKYPMEGRKKIWDRLATDLKPSKLTNDIVNEITLNELPDTLKKILEGQIRGRVIVSFNESEDE